MHGNGAIKKAMFYCPELYRYGIKDLAKCTKMEYFLLWRISIFILCTLTGRILAWMRLKTVPMRYSYYSARS